MSSYLSSLKWPSMPNVLTRSTREIPEDAPLHSLPPEEATPLQQLKHSAVPLLQSPRSPLPIEDPWSSFSQEDNHTLRDEMLLRFLRYNALNPNKALKQLENVLDWRAKSQIGTTVPDVMHGLPAGVPIVQLTDATEQGDALFFAAAEQYQKKAVDHKIQQVAVARLFEHMLYEKTGPRLKRGCVVVDFTGFGVRHVDMHGLHAGVVTYLSYYPDVFAKILLLNYPKLLYGMWRAIAPLLDCRTASRVVWVTETETLHKELDHMFSSDELPTWLGGQKKSGKLKLLNGVEIDPADLTGRF